MVIKEVIESRIRMLSYVDGGINRDRVIIAPADTNREVIEGYLMNGFRRLEHYYEIKNLARFYKEFEKAIAGNVIDTVEGAMYVGRGNGSPYKKVIVLTNTPAIKSEIRK